LAGQIIMEGFLSFRLSPIIRRLITRGAAILPALGVILWLGDKASGDLLILSQVVLSLQLSFAVIPLIHLTSIKRWSGRFTIRLPMQIVSWIIASVIVFLNVQLAFQEISGWLSSAGDSAWLLWATVVPITTGLGLLLVYVTVMPILHRGEIGTGTQLFGVHGIMSFPKVIPPRSPRFIAAAIDFSPADGPILSHTVALAKAAGKGATVLLMHVVESGSARIMGKDSGDTESRIDREHLELYAAELGELGIEASCELGFGQPATQIIDLVTLHRPDVLVLGSHGHRGVGDLVHGTTVESLRHKIDIPILIVPVLGSALRSDPAAK
jgi:manganese transport protein